MHTIIKPCSLQPFTCIAGQRRHDGVLFLALGFAPIDTMEELELSKRLRTLLELNQEVVIVDGDDQHDFTIIVPGHPNRHCDFSIEVTGPVQLPVETVRRIVLARLGLQLPEQPYRYRPRENSTIFYFDGPSVTLTNLVAGTCKYEPPTVLAAFEAKV